MFRMSSPSGYSLVPYVIWLGLTDCIGERVRLSPQQVLAETKIRIRQGWAFTLRRVGIGAAFLSVVVLLATHLVAPTLIVNPPILPNALLGPLCALLSATAAISMVVLFLCASLRVLVRLYVRGLAVVERRSAGQTGGTRLASSAAQSADSEGLLGG
jgi:hypothetical protein